MTLRAVEYSIGRCLIGQGGAAYGVVAFLIASPIRFLTRVLTSAAFSQRWAVYHVFDPGPKETKGRRAVPVVAGIICIYRKKLDGPI